MIQLIYCINNKTICIGTIWVSLMWYKAETSARGYKKVMELIRSACEKDHLKPGEKLPPVRDLAFQLGMAPGTVARAYAEAEKEGLLQGYVGRGTFVAHAGARFPYKRFDGFQEKGQVIDLSLEEPLEAHAPDLAGIMRAMADELSPRYMLDYALPERTTRFNEAGRQWLMTYGVKASTEHVCITGGSQHAIVCSLSATTEAGQSIAVESLAYPGVAGAAAMLGLHMKTVTCDSQGIVPDSLEEVCRKFSVKALYLTPSAQNPTNGQLNEHRRKRIADIAQQYDIAIIEDDLRPRQVLPAPDAIACHAPERTIFIAGLSKAVGGGMRIAYAAVPDRYRQKFKDAIWATMWLPSPITTEITTRLILSGEALSVANAKEREMAKRRILTEERLDRWNVITRIGSSYAWLKLPEGHSNAGTVAGIRAHGVAVLSADAFWTAQAVPPAAIRICLGAPSDIAQLDYALTSIADVLSSEPIRVG